MTGWLIFFGLAGIVYAACYAVVRPKPKRGFLGRSRRERALNMMGVIYLILTGVVLFALHLPMLPR